MLFKKIQTHFKTTQVSLHKMSVLDKTANYVDVKDRFKFVLEKVNLLAIRITRMNMEQSAVLTRDKST